MRKFNTVLYTAIQSLDDFRKESAKKKPAFEFWIDKTRGRDKLPRGKYFKHRKGNFRLILTDECYLIK